MKEFFVGLMTLILMATFIGIGSIAWIILIPVLLVMGILLRVVLVFLLAGLAVWLLGKFVLYIFGKMGKKSGSGLPAGKQGSQGS